LPICLSSARCTGWGSRAESSRLQAALLLLSQDRSFPLYTEWKKKVGFPPFGETPRTTAARNTIASPTLDGNSSEWKPSDGVASPGRSLKRCDPIAWFPLRAVSVQSWSSDSISRGGCSWSLPKRRKSNLLLPFGVERERAILA